MIVGLVARATRSGLGYQSLNFFENYRPEVTLVITNVDSRSEENLHWYPGALVESFKALDHSKELKRFMRYIDVAFSAETMYHPHVLDEAERYGVRTVVQGNPELTRTPDMPGWIGAPSEIVWPTDWLLDKMGGRVLPVPVSYQCYHEAPILERPLKVLHVAGRRAIGDRNGSDVFVDSLRWISTPTHVRIVVQDGFDPQPRGPIPDHVTWEVMRDPKNRETMYAGMHVLVLPRRYGGLCLPALEAMRAGLAIMMSDCPPNRTWPIIPLEAIGGRMQRVAYGSVKTHDVRARVIAQEIDYLNKDRTRLERAVKAARVWVQENQWEQWRPLYDEVLSGQGSRR